MSGGWASVTTPVSKSATAPGESRSIVTSPSGRRSCLTKATRKERDTFSLSHYVHCGVGETLPMSGSHDEVDDAGDLAASRTRCIAGHRSVTDAPSARTENRV